MLKKFLRKFQKDLENDPLYTHQHTYHFIVCIIFLLFMANALDSVIEKYVIQSFTLPLIVGLFLKDGYTRDFVMYGVWTTVIIFGIYRFY